MKNRIWDINGRNFRVSENKEHLQEFKNGEWINLEGDAQKFVTKLILRYTVVQATLKALESVFREKNAT